MSLNIFPNINYKACTFFVQIGPDGVILIVQGP